MGPSSSSSEDDGRGVYVNHIASSAILGYVRYVKRRLDALSGPGHNGHMNTTVLSSLAGSSTDAAPVPSAAAGSSTDHVA